MERTDREACYRALQARDRRFDGRFFVGVTSTGIYCRPICPARTPQLANCRFFPSAAAAQAAGFRACLRCRPEISPELAGWRGTSNTVSRALALIAGGALDADGASVERLAERVGLGERQLRRLFDEHLGASPVSVAQTRRVLFAKQLLHETRLPMSEVAMAAGFGSVRRFNEVFRQLYRRPPSELRRARRSPDEAAVTLHLPYQNPYDWPSMLAYLRARAIEGIEQVHGDCYRRAFSEGGCSGVIEISPDPIRPGLTVRMQNAGVRALPALALRVKHMFDLYADVREIGAHLGKDRVLGRWISQSPGLRTPGGWHPFEVAVRAVLGQQITVAAARQLAGKLVRICAPPGAGAMMDNAAALSFPSPQELWEADLSLLGMPAARRSTLKALARAVLADPGLLEPAGSVNESVARLRAVPGIGEWTAQYIAARALREPDAFPATDIGILRGAAKLYGRAISPTELIDRAEAWRPWRAYAAQHLWAADARLPPTPAARQRPRETEAATISTGSDGEAHRRTARAQG